MNFEGLKVLRDMTIEDKKTELEKHMEHGGVANCSVRLASGNDWVTSIIGIADYKIVEEDIIFEYEIVLCGVEE